MLCRYEIKPLGEAMLTRILSRCLFGGLVCCVAGLLNAQQNPNGRIPVAGMADAYLVLIRDPLVHKELRLSDQQRRAVAALTDELDMTLWTLRNQPAERSGAGFRDLTAKAEARMEPILSRAQAKRLAQIRLSVAGLQVLLRDDIVAKLKLSGDQRTRIETALKEGSAAGDAARPSANGRTAAGKSKPSPNDSSTRIAAILTREQLATARELLGPAINGSQLGYVKFKAPEIEGKDGWINSDPLTMSQLKGKVVALHFWTFG